MQSKSGGLTLDQIRAKQQAPNPLNGFESIDTPGFVQGVKESFKKAQTDIGDTVESGLAGKKSVGSTVLQTLGSGAKFLSDVFLKGVSVLVPDVIEKPVVETVEKGVGAIAKTAPAQQIIKGISDWADQHPEAAKNLEAIIDIASLVPVGKGAQAGAKAGGKVAETAGAALKESAEAALQAERKSFVEGLVRQVQTKAVKEAQVGRTTEVGSGITKRSVIAPSKQEATAVKYVTEIPEVSPKNTVQGNFNVIKEANRAEADKLASELASNDFIYPRKELLSRLRKTKEELARNPVITGDAEKTAEKLIAELERRINATPSKGSNLLQVRKEFDAWVESQKGGTAFDPVKENAFSIANREMRRTINTFLDEKAPSVGVKESLKHQSALFNALDNLRPKAAVEADTAIKRFLQRAEAVLGTKNRAVQIVAAAVGIGGLGAAATFAPAAAATGIGGYLVYRGGKLVLSPQVRKGLGELLIELEKRGAGEALGGVAGAAAGATPAELKDEIEQLINEYSE